MDQTVDIIEGFIAGIDFAQDVISYSNDGTDTTMVVENLLHARTGLTVDVDGSDYIIVSINQTTDAIIVSGVIATPSVITLQTPFYKHGTPRAVNQEIAAQEQSVNKVPLIWLLEIIRERFFDDESSNERQADLRIFFIDEANFEDWDTDDFYNDRLNGLNKLAHFFVEKIKASTLFNGNEIEFYDIINHTFFGKYLDNQGYEKNIFDDELTAVELRIDLLFYKSLICE